MRPTLRRAPILLLLAVTISCSKAISPGTPAGDRDLITREQLGTPRFQTVYDAVSALHPAWLLTRYEDSHKDPGEVLVYKDHGRLGGVTVLRDISTTGIEYIRYYDAASAMLRWGEGHNHGVIFVSTLPEKSR